MSKSTIQLPVIALKPAIAGLSKVINKRSTLPILGSVKITRRTSGELSFEGTDLDAVAIYTTESEKGGKDVTVLVSFDELSTVVKGCAKSAVLELAVEKDQVRLRYPVGSTWLEKPIATFKEDEWPVIPEVTGVYSRLTPEFPKTLVTALDCASDHRDNLTGGWLDVHDPKAHYVVGSDGRQLFTANSFKFNLKESLLIADHKFLHWSGFHEDGEWALRVGPTDKDGNGWTQLESAYWTLLIKQTKVRCPQWKQIIPGDIKTHATFSDEAVACLLDVLPKLPGSTKTHHDVTFDLGPKGTIVRACESDHSSKIDIDGVKVTGNANTFAADRTLIIKALKLGLTNLAVVDGFTPIVFSDATRKLVIAPLRPDSMPATSPAPAPVEPTAAPAISAEPTTNNPEQEGQPVKTVNRINPNEPPQETNTSSSANRLEPQPEELSALKQAIQLVDGIKEKLRDVQSDMNDVLKALNQAHREKRASEKEVEDVRDALQSLQRIRI